MQETEPEEIEEYRVSPDDYPSKDKRSLLEFASVIYGKKMAPYVKEDMDYWEWLYDKPTCSTFDHHELERLYNKYHCDRLEEK